MLRYIILLERHYLSWIKIVSPFANCPCLNTAFHFQWEKVFFQWEVLKFGASSSPVYITIGSMFSSFGNNALSNNFGVFLNY